MSILEDLKELKEAQAAELEAPEVIEEEKPEAVEEIETEIEPEDEGEVDEEEVEEKPKTPSDHRKERLAAKAAEKRELEELRAQVNELRNPKPVEAPRVNEDPEPDRNTQWGQWQEWNTRRLEKELSSIKEAVLPAIQQQSQERMVQTAIQEFKTYESQFAKTVEDYNPAASYLENKIADSLSTLYPTASEAQITQAVNQQLLQMAAQFAAQGLNPAEELYHLAYDKGYAKADEDKKDLKPDMKKVAANRARNAGTAGSTGTAKAVPGLAQLAGDVQAWKRLKPQERLNYLKQLGGQ